MDPLDDLQRRDNEINKALSLANDILRDQDHGDHGGVDGEDDIDQIIELVKSVDVEPAIRRNLVDLDDRTEFAAQLEEIESRVDLDRYNSRGHIQIDERVPAEGRERFLKARVTVLEEELGKLQIELRKTSDKLHKTRRDAQESGEQAEIHSKQNEKLKKEVNKLKTVSTKASSNKDEAERELKLVKRELDDLKRTKKTTNHKQQSDVRLQRALEEAQKYKKEMAELMRRNKDQGLVTRNQFDDLSKESTKTKKLNIEYKSVIQKQSKLIEILRNKCTHLEAARVLEFSEQEFMRVLDWQT